MSLVLRQETLHLGLRDPFRIARSDHGAGHRVTTVIVELRDDRLPGLVGVGEGYPDRFYGETPATMAAVMPVLLEQAESLIADFGDTAATRQALEGLAETWAGTIRGHGAAKCALDIALHDLAGRALGLPVHELLGLSADLPPTDFTIGIDAPEVVAERARRASAFPALKIKVGGPGDVATLEAVRAVFDGPIRVDANTAWTPDDAVAILPDLVRLGVELIEQPFPARRMLERARELGLRTFLGCMEETSVGIAGSAIVASLAEWVDLDGCLLLADDPFEGLELGPDHRWQLAARPGLGLSRRAS